MKYILFILSCLLFSCAQDPEIIASRHFYFSKSADSANLLIAEDSSSKGHHFLRLDSLHKFGFSFDYKLRDTDYNKRLIVVYRGKIRTNHIYSSGSMVSVLSNNSKVTHWRPNNLNRHVADLGKWNWFYDSLSLPKSTKEEPYNTISVQGLLGDAVNETFDFDSVSVYVKGLDL